MARMKCRQEILYPLGVTSAEDGARILVQANGEKVSLLLFKPGEEEPERIIDFKEEDRMGDVWSMEIKGQEIAGMEYMFEVDGVPAADPCARIIAGREQWGDVSRAGRIPRARVLTEEFQWGDDRRPEIPYSDTIIYRLHVRGFTMHPSSGVRKKGTFAGVMEKLPYIKELGATAVELMPITEFDEVLTAESGAGALTAAGKTAASGAPGVPTERTTPEASGGSETPTERSASASGTPMERSKPMASGLMNYWGYGPSFLYALKSAYGSGKTSPEREFKTLVKALHKENMECIVEMYFTGKEAPGMALDVLRYWIQEYHVDGFRLSGFPPIADIAEDPFLKGTKLFAENWGEALARRPGRGYPNLDHKPVTVRDKNLAEYNGQFQNEMRRLLKGDEGMLNSLAYLSRRNPEDFAVINYMANTNGMTMTDMVSYDRKHNEDNHENNRDGTDDNFSWNCGEEGPTRKKAVRELRKRQLGNAFLLLFLSQGTPLLLAGDEFGNSQGGNNNAYCQDNEVGWVDWRQKRTNRDLYAFVKGLIAFRKAHGAFHMDREPRLMDYKSCGRPDVSYHGEYVWRPEFENFRRQFGILYWGAYGRRPDGSADDTIYVIYNMHWEPHVFGLPRLPKGQRWHLYYDTSKGLETGTYGEGMEPVVEDQAEITAAPRSILVLFGKHVSGYYTYDTPVGDITVWCKDEAVAAVRFGRVTPEDKDMEEVRTELSDQVYTELMEYFRGERKEFDLPLAPEGTEFQRKVWNALRTIPWGETRTYKEIAALAGDAKASRAVGMANNKNPIAILIPCHRVVGADGSLVGYAGGLDVKEKLLTIEKGAVEQGI